MYIRDLRAQLQEWRDRLYNTEPIQLSQQLNSIIAALEAEAYINSTLVELDAEAETLVPGPEQRIRDAIDRDMESWLFENERFENDKQRAIYHYIHLKLLRKDDRQIILIPGLSLGQEPREKSQIFVRKYVDPLVHYLLDQIEAASSVLYIFERYKTRCEWFDKTELRQLYEGSQGSQEHVLDKNLRRFLFDQGIDNPYSTPSSPSGRADVVGLLNTKDPLVLEVKLFDRGKRYGKDRIVRGFRQIVSYVNDYSKPIGYLFVFNMDEAEVDIVTSQTTKHWPPRIVFGGKTYFIIIVNIPPCDTPSASQRGQLEKITITESELTIEVA